MNFSNKVYSCKLHFNKTSFRDFGCFFLLILFFLLGSRSSQNWESWSRGRQKEGRFRLQYFKYPFRFSSAQYRTD